LTTGLRAGYNSTLTDRPQANTAQEDKSLNWTGEDEFILYFAAGEFVNYGAAKHI
jgi:hypothetical protein